MSDPVDCSAAELENPGHIEDTVKCAWKPTSRKKKNVSKSKEILLPDLNELPPFDVSQDISPKPIKKRVPRKKKASILAPTPSNCREVSSVTMNIFGQDKVCLPEHNDKSTPTRVDVYIPVTSISLKSTKTVRKYTPRKKKSFLKGYRRH